MPFDSSPISPNPDVRIFLNGLLMLFPAYEDNIQCCDIYAINHHDPGHEPDHELFVDVSLIEEQPNPPFLRLGREVIKSGLDISISKPRGVTKLATTHPDPGPYPLDEALDFNQLHPGVQRNPQGAHKHPIRLRDGVLCTAVRGTQASLLRNGGCTDRAPIGTVIGAHVELGQETLRLDWKSGSVDLPRRRPGEEDPPGSKYVIWISNTRPIPADMNDFKHLYHVLQVDPAQQFDLQFQNCPGDRTPNIRQADTPRIPCIPGVVNA